MSAIVPTHAAEPKAKAQLVSEHKVLVPGETAWLGLHLMLQPGWHVYWKNPGDTGKPPKVEWNKVQGVDIGELQWPAPQRFVVANLVNYGYEKEILIPFQVKTEKNASKGSARISGTASWLICQEECIPETQEVSLTIPLAAGPAVPDVALAKVFDTAKSSIPRQLQLGEVHVDFSDKYKIRVPSSLFFGLKQPTISFFPDQQDWINPMASQAVARDSGDLILTINAMENYPVPEQLSGVLVAQGETSEPIYAVSFSAAVNHTGSESLVLFLIFALLGGLILNLMPCVFPVLGIKILSVLRSSGQSHAHLRKHAYAYTAGILVSFWSLAALLLLIQGFGREVGWGFQLQQPFFVVALASLFFLMALNLLSFFEIGGRFMGVGQLLTRDEGLWGSFFTGFLAVVVATPCSAPFMGAAVGVALLQPGFITVLIFSFLGLGLALPYLVLSLAPGLLRFLPQPGAWMEKLKVFLSIPLLLTVVWLVWVLRAQVTQVFMILFIVSLLIALVLIARANQRRVKKSDGIILASFFLLCILATGIKTYSSDQQVSRTESGMEWQSFSESTLQKLRSTQSPVLVEFTADWCITCKVNERLVLNTDSFAQLVAAQNVKLLRADWTNEDASITKFLKKYGRVGVPFYLLFPPGKDAIVLPQILTIEAIQSALMK